MNLSTSDVNSLVVKSLQQLGNNNNIICLFIYYLCMYIEKNQQIVLERVKSVAAEQQRKTNSLLKSSSVSQREKLDSQTEDKLVKCNSFDTWRQFFFI
jgi:hypothetical protein